MLFLSCVCVRARVCLCLSLHACMCVHECVFVCCMWRPEETLTAFPVTFYLTLLRQGLSLSQDFAVWLRSVQGLPVSNTRYWGSERIRSCLPLCGCWGFELRVSCLQNQCSALTRELSPQPLHHGL